MSAHLHKTAARRAGYTLLELCISATVLGLFTSLSILTLERVRSSAAASAAMHRAQAAAHRSLAALMDAFQSTGYETVDGLDLPQLIEPGKTQAVLEEWAYEAAPIPAGARGAAAEASNSILIALPADTDANGIPDVDADGALIWDTTPIQFLVVAGAGARNQLVRRVSGQADEVVMDNVERVHFQDAESSGWILPLNTLRVRAWVRLDDGQGGTMPYVLDTLVRARNGS